MLKLTTIQTDSFEITRMIGVGWQTYPGTMELKSARKHFNRIMEQGLIPRRPNAHYRIDIIKQRRIRPKYYYTIEDLLK